MRLEEELRRALSRERPPDGFAGRVAARIASAGQSAAMPASRRRTASVGWGMAMAATIAIGTVSSVYYNHRRHVADAERVRNDAVTGLRIASAKLNDVHERLLRLSTQNERMR
ncbi:MAG TPA: hypothetical protein VL243_05095 [Vicinamibacterales bacterium]|nr:hypothetical protein [Vicinamibacterales bacterium]